MKRIFTLSILIFFSFIICKGQKYQKAVVTDVNYLLRYGSAVNKIKFPLYFHHPEFIADIHSDVKKLTKEKFHVDTVVFLYPDSVYVTFDWIAPDIKARDTAKNSNETGTIFISVETILQEGATINNEVTYKLTTRVKAYNKGGKKLYKYKNHIPFVCYSGEEITGDTLMSENDFYAFYFDGLDLAFTGEVQSLDKRFISQPSTLYYDNFLSESEKFYMTQNNNGFNFGHNFDKMTEVLGFKTNIWHSFYNEFDLGFFLKIYGYNLQNKIKNEDYQVKLKSVENTIPGFIMGAPIVTVILNTKDSSSIGEFTYNYGKLKGTLDSDPYTIKWNYDYNVAELMSGDQLIVLFKYLNDRIVIFLHNSVTEKQLGDLFNLIFIYDFSDLVQEKLKIIY